MFFEGLKSVAHEICAILLIWLFVKVLLYMTVRTTVKTLANTLDGDTQEDRDAVKKHTAGVQKTKRTLSTVIDFIAVVALLVCLFFYAPFQRPADEVGVTGSSPVPTSHVTPTVAEIKESNTILIEEQHDKVRKEATEANDAAMKNASKLFKQIVIENTTEGHTSTNEKTIK